MSIRASNSSETEISIHRTTSKWSLSENKSPLLWRELWQWKFSYLSQLSTLKQRFFICLAIASLRIFSLGLDGLWLKAFSICSEISWPEPVLNEIKFNLDWTPFQRRIPLPFAAPVWADVGQILRAHYSEIETLVEILHRSEHALVEKVLFQKNFIRRSWKAEKRRFFLFKKSTLLGFISVWQTLGKKTSKTQEVRAASVERWS